MFEGFSPETVDFLWGIRLNNNREWFSANKASYVKNLYEPMKALGQFLAPLIADRPGTILKVSRIYRDARMHPPEPYKESLWLCIRPDGSQWYENGCLYFEINPEGLDYGFSLWKPRTATMEDFRRQISNHPEPFLSLLQNVETATGQAVAASCYKRPKPCDNPVLLPYFAWKEHIGCARHEAFNEASFGPQLGDRILEFFTQLMPLYDYFDQFRV